MSGNRLQPQTLHEWLKRRGDAHHADGNDAHRESAEQLLQAGWEFAQGVAGHLVAWWSGEPVSDNAKQHMAAARESLYASNEAHARGQIEHLTGATSHAVAKFFELQSDTTEAPSDSNK